MIRLLDQFPDNNAIIFSEYHRGLHDSVLLPFLNCYAKKHDAQVFVLTGDDGKPSKSIY